MFTADEIMEFMGDLEVEKSLTSSCPYPLWKEKLNEISKQLLKQSICGGCGRTTKSTYNKLKKLLIMKKNTTFTDNREYKLKRGVILRWNGSPYSINNITDEIAKAMLKKFPAWIGNFQEIPIKEEQDLTQTPTPTPAITPPETKVEPKPEETVVQPTPTPAVTHTQVKNTVYPYDKNKNKNTNRR